MLLYDMYSSPRMGNRRGAYRVLVGRSEGRKPLGRPRCGWEDNFEIGLQEVGRRGLDLVDLAPYRNRWWAFVNAVMDILIPYNAGDFLTSWGSLRFLGRSLLHGSYSLFCFRTAYGCITCITLGASRLQISGLLWNLVVMWILLLGSGSVEAYIFRDPYCLHPESKVTHLRPSGRPIALVAYMGI
jgi:hypothetical protein